MSEIKFRKMHGLGNDFIILDGREEGVMLSAEQIAKLCDRHFGVGCDLLTVLENSEDADVFARFFNADGSESASCGNATRCVADIIMAEMDQNSCSIETGNGVLACRRVENDLIEVNMGAPKLKWDEIPLSEERDTLMLELGEGAHNPAVAVNMGNPHCILFVDDVENALVERIGPVVEHHPLFPERTNVEFVQLMDDGRLRQRTWERGVGETLACGSGACAVAVAAIRRELIDGREVEIVLNGGALRIRWDEQSNDVFMTGSATHVFDGIIKSL